MLEVSALDRSRTFGETISGHYAVVSVWATWCAPCRTELPQLQALADETGSKGIAIVTINIDDNDHRVREWLRQERVRLPVFRDQHGSVTRLVWGITSVPQILVLAPDGRLLWSGQTFDRTAILEQMKIGWATRGEPRQTADRGRALLCPPGDYGVAVIATSCGSMSLIRT